MKQTTIRFINRRKVSLCIFVITILVIPSFLISCTEKDPPAQPPPVLAPVISSFSPTGGDIGDVVIIKGKNFNATAVNNVVKVSGITATVTNSTDTLLTVIIPEGAATGKISVTVNNETAISLEDFTLLKNAWVQKENLPASISNAVSLYINGNGIVVTGQNYNQKTWFYNTALNKWKQTTNFPGTGRIGAMSFSIGGKGYVGFGRDVHGVDLNDIWSFDPVAETWTRLKDFQGRGRGFCVSFSIKNTGYVTLGDAVAGPPSYTDLWAYDPTTDTWTKKADFPGGFRHWATGAVSGNRAFVGLGRDKKDWWEYNPDSDSWQQGNDFPADIIQAYSFSISNDIYIVAGHNHLTVGFESPTPTLWLFNQNNGSWEQKTTYPGMPAWNPLVFASDKRAYVGGGWGDSVAQFAQFWMYLPE